MSKQLNVNLSFTADTQAAQQKLVELQSQLNLILNSNGLSFSSLGLNKELTEALGKTADLKVALETAMNPKTGTLDLSKFNAQLQKSGTSIQEYAQHLHNLGPMGQQAFSQLAAAINSAEMPLRRTGGLLTSFATTLKNTAKWQISSSLLHGFIGTVKSAYGYAQDLNNSLNDIRIVTGASAEEMARFAEQANNAAKQLNVTTTEYTKGALIYYQQGLDPKQVQERNEITMKMSNITGQSTQQVSDQLTAIWNNYAKGGEDLEHFADVMVRLGADTASSSDEIARGLEKFAAIGDTVGLSFNNAAAALATVTATTRESAETVGTAFKTIFARIQGLKLGETLEDGTDLNKYSEGLASVGISIKDQNGQLKDMDIILEEMGAKWKTLNKDQQVALAQTVAGVRQYNQLMALMQNFDFYQENVARASGADGTLNEQADIYAESWEAASKRVRAAAEDIFDSLLNDKFFIKLTDGFAKFLNIIGDTIDGIGGMKGAFAMLGVVITRVFAKDMAASLNRFAYNIKTFTAAGRQKMLDDQTKLKQQTNQTLRSFGNDGTALGATRADVNTAQASAQDALLLKAQALQSTGRNLTEIEQKKAQLLLDQNRALGEQVIKAAEAREQYEKAASATERQLKIQLASATGKDPVATSNFSKDIQQAKSMQTEFAIGSQILEKFKKQLTGTSDQGKTFAQLKSYVEQFEESLTDSGVKLSHLDKIFNKLKSMNPMDGALNFVNLFETELNDLGADAQIIFDKMASEAQELGNAGKMSPQGVQAFIQALQQLQQEFSETGHYTEDSIAKFKDLQIQLDKTKSTFNGFQGTLPSMADGIVAFGNVLSSVTMAFTTLSGLIDTWNNKDSSFGDKLISTFTTLGMVIPMVTMSFRAQNLAQMATLSTAIAAAVGVKGLSVAEITAALTGDEAAAGTLTFGAAVWTVLWPIGLLMVAIVALVAVIAGLVMLFEDIERSSPENKLKDIETAINDLKTSVSDTKQEIEDLNSSIEEIQNGYDSISKMTAGSVEFKEAVLDLNQQVLELLDLYPQLMDYVTRNEQTGLLEVSQQGFDMLQSSQYIKLGAQQLALNQARARRGELTIETYNEDWSQGGQYTSRSGGKYADKLKKVGSYEDILQMTDKELSEAVGKVSGLAEEIDYHLDGDAALTSTVESLPENWQDEVRTHAKTLKEAEDAQDTTLSDTEVIKNTVFQATGGSKRSEWTVDESVAKDIKNRATEKTKNFDSGWNDHKNYKEGDDQWKDIQRVVKHLGTNASYVAQRQGEMVISVDGEEKKFTEEQFKALLAETYNEEELDKYVKENKVTIEDQLKNSGIKSEVVSGMSDAEKATLDNVKFDLQSVLGDDAGARLFGGMVNDFNSDSTTEATHKLNLMAEAFNAIDWVQGGKAVEEYMGRLDELGIKIDSQNQQALEDYAASFRDYNKLMEGATDHFSKLNKSLEQQAEEVGLSTTAMEAYVKQLKENVKYQELSDKELKEAAIQQKKVRTALDELAESWDSVAEAVRNNDVMSDEYEKGIAALKKAYKELFDLDVSDEFLTAAENIDLMEQALRGSQSAFEELAVLAGKDWLNNLDFSETQIDPDKILNVEGFRTAITQIENYITNAQWTPDDGVYDSAIGKLNDYVRAGKVTAEELNNYFGSVHGIEFETEVQYLKPEEAMAAATESKNTTVTKNIITRSAMTDPTTGEVISKGGTYTEEIASTVTSLGNADVNEKGEIGVPVLKQKGNGTNGSNTKVVPKADVTAGSSARSNTMGTKKGGNNGGGNKNSGGGSSKPAKKSQPTKKKDTVDRYKEIEDKVSKVSDAMDDASKAADRLWGQRRVKQLEKIHNLLHEELYLQKQYRAEIANNLAADKAELLNYMATAGENGLGDFGLQFNIDNTTGFITNYTEVMTTLHNKLNEYEKHYNSLATQEEQSAYAESTLDPFKEKLEWVKDLIAQYDESNELLQEKDNEIQDKINEIRENAIADIDYRINIKIEFNQLELDILDYYIGKISDDFYKIGEAVGYVNQKIKTNKDNLWQAYKPYNDVMWLYNNGLEHITFDEVAKKAQEAIPNLIEALNTIRESDAAMVEYYSHGLDQAQTRFDKFNGFFEKMTTKIEHYRSMLTLIGEETNYDKIDTVLQGQLTVAKNATSSNKAYFEMLKGQYDDLYNDYLAKEGTMGEKEKELLEKRLYDAKIMVDDAEEQYLTSLEETGAIAQEILKNNMASANEILEKNLVGTSMDDYMKSLDRLSKKQEEYLTNTNKLYETNKLIRQAQLDMDQTENVRAKQQYGNYVKYIEQLQQSGQLSSYELSIAQAKYEILQAQIALEEAKDAKNQVRLTRDSEGNYGYVYTANENEISDAEQALADAENKLYNIGLDGAKDYQSKYAETMQEAVDTFNSLTEQYQSGQIKSKEEYNTKMIEAEQYYYGLLSQYNDLYYIGHDLLVEKSYQNEADYLLKGTGNLEDFKIYTNEYLTNINGYFDEYDGNVAEITETVDGNLTTMENGTNDVLVESEGLAKTIKDKLIPAMSNELNVVKNLTTAYADERDELEELNKLYEKRLESLQAINNYATNGTEAMSAATPEQNANTIADMLSSHFQVNSPEIQKMLQANWYQKKNQDTDYQALMNEEAEKNGKNTDLYKAYKAMRDYKLLHTDWLALYKEADEEDKKWIKKVLEEKYNIDYAQEIEDYLQYEGTSEWDSYVQDRLKARQEKIDYLKLGSNVETNEDLMNRIVRGIVKEKEEPKQETQTKQQETPVNDDKKYTKEDIVNQAKYIKDRIWNDGAYGTGWANRLEKAKAELGDKFIQEAFDLAKSVINGQASFDTGGYTGAWGPEGRLAMLHEKELVLNKQDTENFLTATEMLREISKVLDNNALIASLGMINLKAMSIGTPADQVLQQEVTIHADFPNVTDHNEIELAIDNLINAASQHAYRT